jgi:hypothetical protein
VIPLATTTISVVELLTGDDTTAPGAGVTSLTTVPAHFSTPTGRETQGSETVEKVLLCDPIPTLSHRDMVVDEVTFDRYEVVWVDQRPGLGLDHTVAGVHRVRGAA